MELGSIPAVGFGTWPLVGDAAYEAVSQALDIGYRYIDTAMIYDNEGCVGKAIRDFDIERQDIFVASKLPRRFHGRQAALDAVAESSARMGLDHLDLYLIHWPNPDQGLYLETWQGLLDARDRGLVTHVGVCNFTVEYLELLYQHTGELPVVNQVELNPYHPRAELREFHREHRILTQAWSPLGRGGELLSEPALREIASRHGVSEAEVILRWHASLGVMPLPRSGNAHRQRQNLRAVDGELEAADLEKIAALTGKGGTPLDPRTFVQRW